MTQKGDPKTSESRSGKHQTDIRVAKINFWGVVITAVLGLLGVALTAYLGYLGTRSVPAQTPASSTAVIQPTVSAQPTVVNTTAPSTESPSSSSDPGQTNSTTFLWLGGICFSLILVVQLAMLVVASRLRYLRVDDTKLDAGLRVGRLRTQVRVRPDQPDPIAYLNFIGQGLEDEGKIFKIRRRITRIGRRKYAADVVIDSEFISLVHCTIIKRHGEFWIEDAGSTNGTLLNGREITRSELLHSGDVISLGGVKLSFHLLPEEL